MGHAAAGKSSLGNWPAPASDISAHVNQNFFSLLHLLLLSEGNTTVLLLF